MSKNYYDILGVDKSASQDEIKKAYKKLAKQWHPDRFTSKSEAERIEAEEKFKEINEAYNTVGDENKRREYDNPMGGGFSFNGFPGFDFGGGGFSFNFGGGGFSGFGNDSGTDIDVTYKVDLKTIYEGAHEKEFTYMRKERCSTCDGTGLGNWKPCPHCGGKGKFVDRQVTRNGTHITTRICGHCGGTGGTGSGHCKECGGLGLKKKEHKTTVNIQADWLTKNGITINVPDEGDMAKSASGQNGALHVHIVHTYDDKKFVVRGYDIYEQVDIDWYDALLGCTKPITLPNGETVEATIPEYSEHMSVVKLVGKGIKYAPNSRGNYFVCVNVKFAKNLTESDRALIEQIKNGKQ